MYEDSSSLSPLVWGTIPQVSLISLLYDHSLWELLWKLILKILHCLSCYFLFVYLFFIVHQQQPALFASVDVRFHVIWTEDGQDKYRLQSLQKPIFILIRRLRTRFTVTKLHCNSSEVILNIALNIAQNNHNMSLMKGEETNVLWILSEQKEDLRNAKIYIGHLSPRKTCVLDVTYLN